MTCFLSFFLSFFLLSLQTLELIPPTACVGLITFGTTVNVYELAFQHYTKSYVFRGSGDKDIPAEEVQRLLNIGQPGAVRPQKKKKKRTLGQRKSLELCKNSMLFVANFLFFFFFFFFFFFASPQLTNVFVREAKWVRIRTIVLLFLCKQRR